MKKVGQFVVLSLSLFVQQTVCAQNVGIGNTNPLEKLHITGGILSDSIKIGNGNPGSRVFATGIPVLSVSQTTGGAFYAANAPGWQSFTATATTMLDHVSMEMFNAETIELRIYAGEGTTGDILASVSLPPPATWSFNNSPTLNVQVQAGEKYTIWLSNKNTWTMNPWGGYSGGRSDNSPNSDMAFKVYTKNFTTVMNVMSPGTVWLSMDQPGSVVTVNGQVRTNTLQLNNGDAGIGKVLTSDASGNANWKTLDQYWVNGSNSLYLQGRPNMGEDGSSFHRTSGNTYFDHKGSGYIIFRGDNTNGSTSRMMIDCESGNVGINTIPHPDFNLIVNGASKFIQGIYNEGPMIVTGDLHLSGEIQQHNLSIPGLQNNWTNVPGLREPRYYKGRDGRVYLQGSVRNGTSSVIFSLPGGYKPESEIRFIVPSTGVGGITSIKIDLFGSVLCTSFGPVTVSLDGISFRVD